MAISNLGAGTRCAVVVPSDSTLVNCRSVYIGGGGNVSIVAMDDTAPVIFVGLLAGSVLQVACKNIRATGTTATNLIAIF